MKNSLQLSLLFILLGITRLSAQTENIYDNPSYGPDSASRMECANNLSTMSEFMKINLPDYALASWQKVFANCPESSKNIYLYGVRIYRGKIEHAKNEAARASALDTLMLIYDRRIEYFGQEGNVLGRKALDLLKYDQEKVREAYVMLKRSVELSKMHSEPAVMVTLMQASNALFRAGEIEGRELIDNYLTTSNILEKVLKSGRSGDMDEKALNTIETIFASSGAADCAALVEIFQPRFKQSPEDVGFLKKLTLLLSQQGCEDEALFAGASENLYKLEPSAQAAYNLAKLFLKKEVFDKAVSYYQEAIASETDADKKARYLYELGLIQYTRYEDFAKARELAQKAIENKPNWGDPYILIGNLYASSSKLCGENEFEKSTVFWAAVDKFTQAKSVDPSVSKQADELIEKYSQYFPNAEDAFFYGHENGQSYTVGCWINEKTTVRTRQ
jgi:tetratricopeptide (TPR) repeat protein